MFIFCRRQPYRHTMVDDNAAIAGGSILSKFANVGWRLSIASIFLGVYLLYSAGIDSHTLSQEEKNLPDGRPLYANLKLNPNSKWRSSNLPGDWFDLSNKFGELVNVNPLDWQRVAVFRSQPVHAEAPADHHVISRADFQIDVARPSLSSRPDGHEESNWIVLHFRGQQEGHTTLIAFVIPDTNPNFAHEVLSIAQLMRNLVKNPHQYGTGITLVIAQTEGGLRQFLDLQGEGGILRDDVRFLVEEYDRGSWSVVHEWPSNEIGVLRSAIVHNMSCATPTAVMMQTNYRHDINPNSDIIQIIGNHLTPEVPSIEYQIVNGMFNIGSSTAMHGQLMSSNIHSTTLHHLCDPHVIIRDGKRIGAINTIKLMALIRSLSFLHEWPHRGALSYLFAGSHSKVFENPQWVPLGAALFVIPALTFTIYLFKPNHELQYDFGPQIIHHMIVSSFLGMAVVSSSKRLLPRLVDSVDETILSREVNESLKLCVKVFSR
eukprot:GHVH01008291.1.p1 GENE.GHVH01008291.1~~GHVH01008291.1.p1  ORF type:complete len:489 (+),score=57.48 GHVH01008291.1:16-1482(+)